ncbi:hypothetical protein E4U17_005073 [Claviceps sp. LM77 group G4]|nr:hypothetical protein E4U17_005073 [Claviceps sp. LM77 group G4]KAG6074552.1 hypothetical protein E4U33_002458 [Claviceps sp. LM78 group G4]KAG6075436.1 hypothetical protein E4U16_003350 [Claviceps sp. LM84 group G4]
MTAIDAFSLPSDLGQARIKGLPSTAYYIPNFISSEEEQLILDKIAAAPKPRWKQLTHRRLQTWPSGLVQDRLLDAPLPAWLEDPVVSRLLSLPTAANTPTPSSASEAAIVSSHIFSQSPHQRPNHVLINEYPRGDGAAYSPVVCTVSLGSSLCLNLHRSKEDGALDAVPAWRILQEPRSLLITTDTLYTDYLHGIADIEEDVNLSADSIANWSLLRDAHLFADGCNSRKTRTSLTYRDVLKVSKIGSKLNMFLKR